MRDLWIQTEMVFATWVADLSALRSRPADMLPVVEAIVEAGERHRVFTLIEAPLIGFQRGDGATVADLVRKRWDDERVVDLFAFTGSAMKPGAPRSSVAEATVAWYDASDELVEAPVNDLGALLRSLEPVPGSISNGSTCSYPPLRITGPELVYDPSRSEPVGPSARRSPQIRVEIHSDIWFPFVFGTNHPQADFRRMFDNRELASRHTPRLNAFLVEVGQRVKAAGGSWRVDEEESGKNALLWLDEDGILLDAPEPELFPASALAAEWY